MESNNFLLLYSLLAGIKRKSSHLLFAVFPIYVFELQQKHNTYISIMRRFYELISRFSQAYTRTMQSVNQV